MRGLSLTELGQQIAVMDEHLAASLLRRMRISREVERIKGPQGKLYNQQRETDRLRRIRRLARKDGLNPDFAQSILYSIIGESCKVQMIQRETERDEPRTDGSLEALKQNLLSLTAKVCTSYDKNYSKKHSATALYQNFEMRLLRQAMRLAPKNGLGLDLGCATGRIGLVLSKVFPEVLGIELSADMIEVANSKIKSESVTFKVADMEEGIPLADSTVSVIAMTLGTASDIPSIEFVIKECRRVLMPQGRFLLSFYNKDSLVYTSYLPWEESLVAEMNMKKNWLEVHYKEELFPIFAKPYTRSEVQTFLTSAGLKLNRICTYPTVSALLPEELLRNKAFRDKLREIDEALASSDKGAYIIVTGSKE